MELNPGKCHFMLIGQSNDLTSLHISNSIIPATNMECLLGVTIYSDLTFSQHLNGVIAKANKKINALSRVSPYMNQIQRKIVFQSFVKSQFTYCPLIWMFCNRSENNRINRLHERALRLVNSDNNSTFEELLVQSRDVTIHHSNIQKLVTEVYKFSNSLGPPILNEIFKKREMPYNLRSFREIETLYPKSVRHGTESLSYKASQIWNDVPYDLKEVSTLNQFKEKIKLWRCNDCTCRLCKTYLHRVGFID